MGALGIGCNYRHRRLEGHHTQGPTLSGDPSILLAAARYPARAHRAATFSRDVCVTGAATAAPERARVDAVESVLGKQKVRKF